MNRIIAIALLVGGMSLLVFGVNAMNSASSDLLRLFTGAPSDRAIWMLVCGTAAAAAGLGVMLFGSRAG